MVIETELIFETEISLVVWPTCILLVRSIDTGIGNTFKGNFYSILFSNNLLFSVHTSRWCCFLQTVDKWWNSEHLLRRISEAFTLS